MIDHGFGVKLGPLESKYLATIQAWRNDPRVWKWCRQMKPIADVEQEAWFERQANDPTIQMYAVLANERISGVCGFTSIDLINRRAEFSLYIDPSMFGRGLGTKALKTLLSHGFKQWGFHSIWGEVFAENPAMSLFQSLGFKTQGIRKDFYFRDGKFIDATLISILSDEFFSKYMGVG